MQPKQHSNSKTITQSMSENAGPWGKTMSEMFANGPFQADSLTNFVIEAEGVDFHVHRFVLSMRSELFRKMLMTENAMLEARTGRMVVPDVSADVVEQFLKRLYDPKALIKIRSICFRPDLHAIANLFNMHGLRDCVEDCGHLCFTWLAFASSLPGGFDTSLVFAAFTLGVRMELDWLFQKTLFILSHLPADAVFLSPHFKALDREVLDRLIRAQHEFIASTPEDLRKAIVKK